LKKKVRILVAVEDSGFLRMMEDSLKASGGLHTVKKVASGEECLRMLQKEKFDILLLDHALSDGEGLGWLRRFSQLESASPPFSYCKRGTSLALEAMKEGVFDYINRSAECAKAFPFVVNRAIEGYSLMLEKVRLQKELIETKNFLESIVEKAGMPSRRLIWRERFSTGTKVPSVSMDFKKRKPWENACPTCSIHGMRKGDRKKTV